MVNQVHIIALKALFRGQYSAFKKISACNVVLLEMQCVEIPNFLVGPFGSQKRYFKPLKQPVSGASNK